jgi:hypothetical protein
MGLVYEKKVRTVTAVPLCVYKGPCQEHVYMCDSHLSHLNQADFDLRANYSYAQLTTDQDFLQPRHGSQILISEDLLQCGYETWLHPFHTYCVYSHSPGSHPFHSKQYQYQFLDCVFLRAVDRVTRFR